MKIWTRGNKYFKIKPIQHDIVGVMANTKSEKKKLFGFLLKLENDKTDMTYSVLLSDLQITAEIKDTFAGRGYVFADHLVVVEDIIEDYPSAGGLVIPAEHRSISANNTTTQGEDDGQQDDGTTEEPKNTGGVVHSDLSSLWG